MSFCSVGFVGSVGKVFCKFSRKFRNKIIIIIPAIKIYSTCIVLIYVYKKIVDKCKKIVDKCKKIVDKCKK
jgi:hypothetical protein